MIDNITSNALEQIQDSMKEVEDARADISLSKAAKLSLEKTLVLLRRAERNIIKKKQEEMVASLTTDSAALLKIADQIKASAEKLDKVSIAVQKAGRVLEALIKIITTAASEGLL